MKALRFVFIFTAICFLSFSTVAFAGKNCSSPTADAIREYGIDRYNDGDYVDAQHEFSKCLMVEPECSACSDYLGKISNLPEDVLAQTLDRREKMPVAVLEKQTIDECRSFIFDGTKSYDPDGKIISYDWDFGDGKKASGATVTHAYAKTGKYIVKLTVTDDSGIDCNKSFITEELEVAGAPEIDIEAPATSCPNTELDFRAKVDSKKKDSIVVTWDFGDGNQAQGLNVKHIYAKGGNYIVKAKVVDNSLTVCNTAVAEASVKINNAPKAVAGEDIVRCFPASEPVLEVKFDGSASEGDSLSYHWDFGDGVTSDLARPVHVYRKSGKYNVKLTVTDASGSKCNKSEDSISVILNHPPVADAGENKVCCLNEPVIFDASRSSDPDGDKLSYMWDFGDGATAQSKEATHTYKKAGEYKVILQVSDNFSLSNCNSSTDEFITRVQQVPVAVMNIKPYYSEENK